MVASSGLPPSFGHRALIAAAAAAFVFVLFWTIYELSHVLLFVFAGLLLAVFLHGIADFITRHTGLWRPASLALVLLILAGLATAFCWMAGPRLVDQLQGLTDQIAKFLAQLNEELRGSWASPLVNELPSVPEMLPAPDEIIGKIPAALSITTETVAMAVFALFLGIYAAANPRRYVDSLVLLVPEPHRARAWHVVALLLRALRWWLVGRAVTMAAMGVLTGLGLWLLGMPMALSLGIIAGLFQFVPYLGAIASAIPALLVAFTMSPWMAVKVAALYIGIHLVEGYAATPLIQQQAVALPPAALLTMQVIMGVLLGLNGVILASPLTVVLIVLIQALYIHDVLGDSVKVLGQH